MFQRLFRFGIAVAFITTTAAQAQPVVVISPHGGSVGSTFSATVEICLPDLHPISTYSFFYAGNDVTSEFSGGMTSPAAWCAMLSPDPAYEVWTAELTTVCGSQDFTASVVDNQNFQGNDGAVLSGCSSLKEMGLSLRSFYSEDSSKNPGPTISASGGIRPPYSSAGKVCFATRSGIFG